MKIIYMEFGNIIDIVYCIVMLYLEVFLKLFYNEKKLFYILGNGDVR